VVLCFVYLVWYYESVIVNTRLQSDAHERKCSCFISPIEHEDESEGKNRVVVVDIFLVRRSLCFRTLCTHSTRGFIR